MSNHVRRNVPVALVIVALAWACSSDETTSAGSGGGPSGTGAQGGTAGTAGSGGGAGSSGAGGTAGTSGAAGIAGTGGKSGAAGTGGTGGLAGASGSAGNISAIWASEGGDKVAQAELRASQPNGRAFRDHVFDGDRIRIAGARNEVVNFNLVLEAATEPATDVHVSFDTLTGPGGATIQSQPATGNGVFQWVGRPIELFYVRYLSIKGLSQLGYESYYDERHAPERLRRPWSGNGLAESGTVWQDRPDHDAAYPDIAVPIELVPSFDIASGHNQSVWTDVYIPRDATPGLYAGVITITQGGGNVATVPVELTVHKFALPETPTAKTMLYWSGENINDRHLGMSYVASGPDADRARLIQDRHVLLAHRHRISVMGDGSNIQDDEGAADQPSPSAAARLRGDFFTAANGYEGPGVNVGNGVYSVGTYGSWSGSWGNSEQQMRQHADAWVTWFEANAPEAEYFLYLIDESSDYAQIELWSQWLENNPGPGHRLDSMATISLPAAAANTPTLDIPTSAAGFGLTSAWETSAQQYTQDPDKHFYLYNGTRPGAGCFMTEDDGVALRVVGWIQYKKHIDRWFYWESTYYDDFQGGSGKLNLFESAHTFGSYTSDDPVEGQTGWNYSNGDGVLFYPGTDTVFPAESYGVDGPLASLRLKYWRRGIQDHDYLALASQINPSAVDAIVQNIIPSVVWDVGVDEPSDPTYVHADISWSTDPDVWEDARAELASIINDATP